MRRSVSQPLAASIWSCRAPSSSMSLVHLLVGLRLAELLGDRVVAIDHVQQRLDRGQEVFADGLVQVELRLLGDQTHPHLRGQPRLALEILVDAGHDLQQRAFAGAVFADRRRSWRRNRTTARCRGGRPCRRNFCTPVSFHRQIAEAQTTPFLGLSRKDGKNSKHEIHLNKFERRDGTQKSETCNPKTVPLSYPSAPFQGWALGGDGDRFHTSRCPSLSRISRIHCPFSNSSVIVVGPPEIEGFWNVKRQISLSPE